MRRYLGLMTVVAGLLAGALPAASQEAPPCGTRAHVLQILTGHHGETRRQTGWVSGEGIVEIYASDNSGSWTLTLTLPQGKTCLMASGHGALTRPMPPKIAEHPA